MRKNGITAPSFVASSYRTELEEKKRIITCHEFWSKICSLKLLLILFNIFAVIPLIIILIITLVYADYTLLENANFQGSITVEQTFQFLNQLFEKYVHYSNSIKTAIQNELFNHNEFKYGKNFLYSLHHPPETAGLFYCLLKDKVLVSIHSDENSTWYYFGRNQTLTKMTESSNSEHPFELTNEIWYKSLLLIISSY